MCAHYFTYSVSMFTFASPRRPMLHSEARVAKPYGLSIPAIDMVGLRCDVYVYLT